MNKKEILRKIKDRFGTVTEFAKRHKIHRVVVYQSIDGSGSRQARLLIAQVIGMEPSKIWETKPTEDEIYKNITANHSSKLLASKNHD